MKSMISATAIAASGLFCLVPLYANAADGTITFTGNVTDTTCSINGNASGTPADKTVTLADVPTGSLTQVGNTAGTTNSADLQFVLTGCSGTATKVIAGFENGPTVDQATGFLSSSGTAKNVEVQLLNAQMQVINVTTGANNDIGSNGVTIDVDGATTLQYYARYYATAAAAPGTVISSVQYTMEYQ
ncbi:fimbrial protein [Paraburkholderia sp. BL25I1N1]|uniref:fimbrial protein n=1 Tax=Paraburkholderia sp. BL25I1N1 TaxID=1938804 RepID=UPI000D07FF43|nr:fimbrial protein [Paraburkholderia sp. BL25I1N1]PRY05867.1 major type 1 subunit fimbrin (pilin) [Paraburkholderia sp. BL25I1N1]